MAEGGSTVEQKTVQTPEGRRLAYRRVEGASPGVVFLHDLASDMSDEKALALESYCVKQGRACLCFDLSGHGRSSEKFTECNLTMWLEDMKAVLSELARGPQVLVGAGTGGWLMFLYTMRNPEQVAGLIGVAPAPDFTPQLWKGLDADTKRRVRRSGVYELELPGSSEPVQVTMQLIQDGDKYSVLDMPGIEIIKVPTTLIHGERDTVVPVSTSLKLMQRLQVQVSLKTIEEGEHRLCSPDHIRLLLDEVTRMLNPDSSEDPED